MARQYRVLRKIATKTVTAGGVDSIDLPRDYDVESYFIRVSGSVQVTVAGAAVRAEAPSQIVRTLEVVADGKNTLFKAPMWAIGLGNLDRHITDTNSRVNTPPTAASIATYAVECFGVIDFASMAAVRPKDSALRTGGYSTLQLNLQYGLANDLFTGTPTAVFSNMTVEIFAQQIVEFPGADGKITSPVAMRRTSYSEQSIPASNSALEIRLPSGNLIRSCLVRAEGSVTAGEPSVAMINNLILSAGVDVRFNVTGPGLRAKNNADYGQVTNGYYLADVCTRAGSAQSLLDLWDVSGSAEPKITLDVVGGTNNKVQVVTQEYILR
jgi:hypothetical protein